MVNAPKANAVIGQSGGPTAVINESLIGIIEQACMHAEIENIYGAIHGVSGIVTENFVDLKKLSVETLDVVAASPCSALGSTRDKPDDEYCERIFKVFAKYNVRYFFYIGGNDSANTAYIVNKAALKSGYDLRAFHVPKTIDNDLLVTDHCPGYGTAAKFVASAFIGDDLDNRALPGVKINVIMGRHAGFLTAASVLARQREDDGPHLVYVPEKGISLAQVLADVEAVYSKLGRCVIAKSEGMRDVNGITWAEKIVKQTEMDAHGNIQLSGSGILADFLAASIRSKLKIKRVRADTFGYLQRSFAGVRSMVDAHEARICGRYAVTLAMQHKSGSVAIRRLNGPNDYQIELFRTELENVAEKTKRMPDEFINAEGNGVTEAFIKYARPLVGNLPKTAYLGNYPRIQAD